MFDINESVKTKLNTILTSK